MSIELAAVHDPLPSGEDVFRFDSDKVVTIEALPIDSNIPLKPHWYPIRIRVFTSPEFAHLRREYFTIIIRAVVLVTILMWACLPVYWAALASSAKLTTKLDAWFIDRDQSRVGRILWATFGNASIPGPRLGWNLVDPNDIGSDGDVAQAIIDERAWIAVVISANATSTLSQARQNGDSSYNPNSAITVYYNQGRNEVAASNYIVPITTNLLQETTRAYATLAAQMYLAQVHAQGQVNATALALLAQAPQTVSPALGWTMINLRPYTAPVATAVTLVGQIFLCIFAFITTIANASARALVQHHLRFSSYLALRLSVPLAVYLPLSLSYALVNVAFRLPFGAKFPYAGGFFLFFIYVYLGMAALGLALEAAITLLTPKFTPFFLFALIIINISAAVLPDALQTPFYVYGAAFPVWNLSQAVRAIIFNTRSYLPRNAGILLGWTVLSCCTLSIFTWFVRWRHIVWSNRKESNART